ncbi:MAG: hypothetical protein ACKVT0_08150, partial [Planctomycetaceae bacterium]
GTGQGVGDFLVAAAGVLAKLITDFISGFGSDAFIAVIQSINEGHHDFGIANAVEATAQLVNRRTTFRGMASGLRFVNQLSDDTRIGIAAFFLGAFVLTAFIFGAFVLAAFFLGTLFFCAFVLTAFFFGTLILAAFFLGALFFRAFILTALFFVFAARLLFGFAFLFATHKTILGELRHLRHFPIETAVAAFVFFAAVVRAELGQAKFRQVETAVAAIVFAAVVRTELGQAEFRQVETTVAAFVFAAIIRTELGHTELRQVETMSTAVVATAVVAEFWHFQLRQAKTAFVTAIFLGFAAIIFLPAELRELEGIAAFFFARIFAAIVAPLDFGES